MGDGRGELGTRLAIEGGRGLKMTRVLVKGSYLKWEVEVVAWSYGEDDGNKGGVTSTGDGVQGTGPPRVLERS